ncbi:MAG TPA: hypothetical protein VFM82_03190 [Flavobacteriaceae bacterium]|nr:hypothetical protein [Flavobacteriaceae bacterium]
MKYSIALMAFLISISGFAQKDSEAANKDILSQTIITKTITKTSKGTDVDTKRVELTAAEALALEQDGTTNQHVYRKPLGVTKKTSFSLDGNTYLFEPDDKGILIISTKEGKKSNFGKIRKMERPNSYLLITKQGNSFGYFNNQGDFIVESYDPMDDSFTVMKFNVKKEDFEK